VIAAWVSPRFGKVKKPSKVLQLSENTVAIRSRRESYAEFYEY
jgi:hypothetical protein